MPVDSRVRRFVLSYLRPEVFFSLSWRVSMAVSGLVSVYFISRHLTPTEQGYWYSFDSLAIARSVFELGFSMVLMQVTSHEYPDLRWSNGVLEGDPEAKARVSALLRQSVIWYLGVAILTFMVCIGAGSYLFGRAADQVGWRGPWYAASLMTCCLVSLTPMAAILEGSGKLASVARMRFSDSVISSSCLWIALASGKHLFAMAAGLGASFCFQMLWFSGRLRFFLDLWKAFLPSARHFWKQHVWPFQQRIAVSYGFGYFIILSQAPLAFAVVGPVGAGKLGMSLTIAQGILSLSTSIVKASAPRFGELIQQRRWADLDRSFQLSLGQSLAVSGLLAAGIESLVIVANVMDLPIASRVFGPATIGCVLAGAVLSCVNQAMAIYLRAHKAEPLMTASITIAAACLPVNYVLMKWLGAPGGAVGFLLVQGIANGIWVYLLFQKHRRNQPAMAPEYVLP